MGKRVRGENKAIWFERRSTSLRVALFLLCCPAYDDLVVPLKKSCPEAFNAVNNAGITPEDLLTWMKHKEVNIDTVTQCQRINRIKCSPGF